MSQRPGSTYPEPVGRIDLNADLGEGVGDDAALLGIVTSANIATGAHAGGGDVLRRAVAEAADRNVALGAHPSYRDRPGFGRASHLPALRADAPATRSFIKDLAAQVLAVADEADRHDRVLSHVKPHGSLYNEAVLDPLAADIVVAAVRAVADTLGHSPAVVTQPHGHLWERARAAGLIVLAEGFVDRRYLGSGHLVGRATPGAVLEDVAAMVEQALRLAGSTVVAQDGSALRMPVDSLCVHGDTPDAVRAARAVRSALEGAGWQVTAMDARGEGGSPSDPASAAGPGEGTS